MLKYIVVSFVVGGLVGASAYKYYQKPLILKEIEVVTKDKIVTVTKKVKEPNGQVTTETTKTEDKQVSASKVQLAKKEPDWLLGLDYTTKQNVVGSVSRRIIGPFFVNVSASTDGTLAAGVRWEF